VTNYILDRLEKTAYSIGAKIILVYIPHCDINFNPDEVKPLPGELRSALKNRKIILIDLANDVRSYYLTNPVDNLCLGGVDAHPSEKYHEIISNRVQKEILNYSIFPN
jgi:hypothetical protein